MWEADMAARWIDRCVSYVKLSFSDVCEHWNKAKYKNNYRQQQNKDVHL